MLRGEHGASLFMGSVRRCGVYQKMSLDEAIASGQKVYWTGKQCKRGHFDFRYTSNGNCAECQVTRARKDQAQKARNFSKMLLVDEKMEERRLGKELYDY